MSLRDSSKASNPETLFLESLPVIDRMVSMLGNRNGLNESDTEEFGSWARAKLIESDYAVFRKFGGRSALSTYLSVVLANLLKDYRNSRWGRWRPSATAKRLGPLAIRFETLVYRDGHPAREAVEVLKAKGAAEAEIKTFAIRIPPRAPVRVVSLDSASETLVQAPERQSEESELPGMVAAAVAELSPEDQIVVRMRFWDDFTVADIARTLGIEQKPLYRRLEAIQAALGASLARRGLDRGRVAEILAQAGGDG
jgi:RNA polymerase sigma factor (sigma-70 family)